MQLVEVYNFTLKSQRERKEMGVCSDNGAVKRGGRYSGIIVGEVKNVVSVTEFQRSYVFLTLKIGAIYSSYLYFDSLEQEKIKPSIEMQ